VALLITTAVSISFHLLLPAELGPYLIGAAVASCGWGLYLLMVRFGGISGHQTGIAAEEWTAGELRVLRWKRLGWKTANHILLERSDVDHVALGPGGFFAIETKYRSNWRDADIESIAAQARHGAQRLRPRLGPKAVVRAVVVIWGQGARERCPQPSEEADVVFCCGPDLVPFLLDQSTVIDPEAVQSAYQQLLDNSRRRDIAELAEDGPFARPAIYGVVDTAAVALAVMCTTSATLAPVSLQPAGWWSVAAATVTTSICAALRQRVANLTVRYFLLAVATTAAGLGVIVLAATLFNALN